MKIPARYYASCHVATWLFSVCLGSTVCGQQATESEKPPGLPDLQFRNWSGDINVPDPVAVSVDDQGRVYATQTRRRKVQDLDIRQHRSWVATDVGLSSVEAKRAFYRDVMKIGGDQEKQREHVGDINGDGQHDWRDLTVISEVIYRVEDVDQSGTADAIVTFAEDFKTEVTGVAAGVLAHAGDVYATVAPDLWKLTDSNADGRAESQVSIAHGFGLHIAYGGHDMHGLSVGPDGKIYWSIGDKGINLTTADGTNYAYPNQGGVMRCNPDGSDFEVFARGLRNVQEPAFDQYGNLFGVDNDADMPRERERFVYIVNEMDAGWRCNYQYRQELYNPWTAEKLWQLPSDKHPAYIIPPISHYVDGPAGFKFNPGTALAPQYRNYFFLTSAPNGYQYAFGVEPQGDSFRMVNDHLIGSGIAIVGLAFGPDGALYGADWDGGYPLDEKGGIVRIDTAPEAADPLRGEVAQLLSEGMQDREAEELVGLLRHADMRVRLRAQFELAERNDTYALARMAQDQTAGTVPRLHGVWGLGQVGRRGDLLARDTLVLLMSDEEPHVRRQSAKTYGELHSVDGFPLIKLLGDEDAHVRTLAGLALARQPTGAALEALLEQTTKLEEAAHYNRHGLVMALSRCAQAEELAAEADHENELRRLCCALALRRQASPLVAKFLNDQSTWVADAAARAIYDDNSIDQAMDALAAALTGRQEQTEPFLQRAVGANYRLGTAEAAERLAEFAADPSRSIASRVTALGALSLWRDSPALDRVDGRNRGPAREGQMDKAKLQPMIGRLLANDEAELRRAALRSVRSLELDVSMDSLAEIIADPNADGGLRSQALDTLVGNLRRTVKLAADSGSRPLQLQAIEAFPMLPLQDALDASKLLLLSRRDSQPPVASVVKQACVAFLSASQAPAANTLLVELANELSSGTIDPDIALDLQTALRQVEDPMAQSALAQLEVYASTLIADQQLKPFAFALHGGDPAAGEKIFNTHVQAQCSRCHRVGPEGSNIGPELTELAKKRDSVYRLRAIVEPSKDIDDKYRSTMFLLYSGEVVSGVVQSETDEVVSIVNSQAEQIDIPTEEIEDRVVQTVSLMPDMREVLNMAELRNLLSYLNTLK